MTSAEAYRSAMAARESITQKKVEEARSAIQAAVDEGNIYTEFMVPHWAVAGVEKALQADGYRVRANDGGYMEIYFEVRL